MYPIIQKLRSCRYVSPDVLLEEEIDGGWKTLTRLSLLTPSQKWTVRRSEDELMDEAVLELICRFSNSILDELGIHEIETWPLQSYGSCWVLLLL
jgi:hypothetical protein